MNPTPAPTARWDGQRWLTPDGRLWWDGQRWRPVARGPVPGWNPNAAIPVFGKRGVKVGLGTVVGVAVFVAALFASGAVSIQHHDYLGGTSIRVANLCYWPGYNTGIQANVPFC